MKKRIFLTLCIMVLVLAVSGCAIARSDREESAYNNSGVGGGMAPMEAPAAEAPMMEADQAFYDGVAEQEAASVASVDLSTERLIIKTGYISLRVNDTVATKESIEGIISDLTQEGAFIVYSNQYGAEDESPYISIQIRVPATEFDIVMDQISDMAAEGTTPERNENADDVTEEFVDVQSRLESLQAARDRLLGLMENAETTEDLLAAEQQLTQREAEIESLQGRMNYLSESARLSAISVEIAPYILSQPVDTTWRPLETIRRAFDSLLDGLEGFMDFLIFFIIAVLPILAIVGLIIFAFVKGIIAITRRSKRAKADKQTPPSEEGTP